MRLLYPGMRRHELGRGEAGSLQPRGSGDVTDSEDAKGTELAGLMVERSQGDALCGGILKKHPQSEY